MQCCNLTGLGPIVTCTSFNYFYSRKWREEKAALLEKLDKEEREAIEEWREQAKKELHDWYERRDEQLGKTKASNRYEQEMTQMAVQVQYGAADHFVVVVCVRVIPLLEVIVALFMTTD